MASRAWTNAAAQFDGNVHVMSTQSRHCSTRPLSHLHSPAFLAFLSSLPLHLTCCAELRDQLGATERSHHWSERCEDLIKCVSHLRGAVLTAGFLEITVVCDWREGQASVSMQLLQNVRLCKVIFLSRLPLNNTLSSSLESSNHFHWLSERQTPRAAWESAASSRVPSLFMGWDPNLFHEHVTLCEGKFVAFTHISANMHPDRTS